MSPARIFALCAAASLLIPIGLTAAGQRGGGTRGGGRGGTGGVGRSYRGGTISSTYGPARIRRSPAGTRYVPARSRLTGSYFRRGFGGGGLFYVPLWPDARGWEQARSFLVNRSETPSRHRTAAAWRAFVHSADAAHHVAAVCRHNLATSESRERRPVLRSTSMGFSSEPPRISAARPTA